MRLIDADALLDSIEGQKFSGWGNCKVEIDDAPTIDAVPVVRCGECAHRGELNNWCFYWNNGRVPADGYCHEGSRVKTRRVTVYLRKKVK